MSINRNILLMACILLMSGLTLPFSAADEMAVPTVRYIAEEFPPFVYLEDGRPTGLGVELLIEIRNETGLEITPKAIDILPLHEGLNLTADTPGTIFFSIARSPEREEKYAWIGPFASYDIVLFSLRSRNITIASPEDLAQYTIGAVTSDIAISEIKRQNIPEVKILTRDEPEDLIVDLNEGVIDVFATGDMAGEYFIRKEGFRPELYTIVYHLNTIPLYFVLSRETPNNMINQFQEGLDKIKIPEDGELSRYDKIVHSWLPSIGLGRLTYYTEEYYPYNYQDNGTAKGIAVDILKEVFSILKTDIPDRSIRFVPWEEGYNTALSTPDTVIFSTVQIPEREDLFLWAGPVVSHKNVIFTRNLTIKDLGDPINRSMFCIGVVTDDSANHDLENAGFSRVHSTSEAFNLIGALEKGEIDGFAYAESTGWNLINRYAEEPTSFRVAYEFDPNLLYFAFHKTTPETLVRSFQSALDIIRTEKDKDGIARYERILYQYLTPGYALEPISEEQVLDLIHTTADSLSLNAEKTIRNINQGISPYIDSKNPDLYVFVYDTDVNMVAHAANPRMVGANYHLKTDVAGNAFRDEIVQGALENGTGWVAYVYSNPIYSGLYWKTTAYKLVTGSDGNRYVVCSGMYLTNHSQEE